MLIVLYIMYILIFADRDNSEAGGSQSHRLQQERAGHFSGGQPGPCSHSETLTKPQEEIQGIPDSSEQWRK